MHYLRVGALLGGAAFGLLGLRRALLISPLPPRNERRILPGLDHEVEVVIDRSGVPHIRAESAHDLLFSQGYCHARDRFWQMDLNRRLARGELAEIFGPQAIPADRFLRRLGFRLYAERDATAIDDEVRAALEAYAAGVNAYRANHRRPIEYMLLRTEPRPWTVLDSLSFGRYMSWTQMTNWDTELTRARLIAKLGAERAAALEGGDPAPGIPRDGSEPHLDLVQAARAFAPLAGLFRGAASNNWVVAPARSESGHALLANDPHLFPRMPGVWYVAHLEGGGYDVAGATIPGLPGVIIGHNRDIAWGVTAGMVDAEDLLIERDLVGARRMSEKIVVRGGEPVTEEIVIGRHGPVISGTLDIPRDGAVLALRSVLHDFPSPTSALLRLNRASDWESFLDALRDWHFPSLNFVYADRSGTIGYKLAGQVPIRAGPAIGLPSQDLDGMQAWNGYVPFDAMPEQHDPTEGILASANNRPPGPVSHFLGADWCDDARWRRIMELLRARRRHDLDSLARIQADQRSLSALAVVEKALGQIRAQDPIQGRALERLRSWDGEMGPKSVAATVAAVLCDDLIRGLNGDLDGRSLDAIVGRGLDPVLAPVSGFYFRRASNLLAQLDLAADEKLQEAFESATSRLRRSLGDNVEGWHWGRIHQIRFTHPIGAAAPLIDRFLRLSRGPIAIGGDTDTIAQAGVNPWHPYQATGFTVSYRQLFDLSDWDKARFCLPTGQSGHPGSHHYDDMLEAWRTVRYRPLPFSRAAVDSQAEERIGLRPPETSQAGRR